MKKIDIYEIVVKIFGFYLLLPIVTNLGNIIFSHFVIKLSSDNFGRQETSILEFAEIFTIIVLLIISVLCLFATKTIANIITNEDDKTKKLDFKIDKQSLYQISLLITGLLMALWALPEFCLSIYNHFAAANRGIENPRQEKEFISVLSRLIIGLFILLGATPLSLLFVKKDNDLRNAKQE